MSQHHPDDITLVDYSAGSLSMAQALAVSVHLFFCTSCREQVKKLNTIGGVLLEETPPASLDKGGFDNLMQRLTQEKSAAALTEEPPRKTSGSTGYINPLQRYLPTDLAQLPWSQQTREIGKYDLSSIINVRGFKVALQKIKAGAKVPVHTHKGTEITVILSGGFSDELGVYHAGDFVSRDPSHHHSPTALQNEDCICLTVLDAPIRFTGRWYRLLNPFMR